MYSRMLIPLDGSTIAEQALPYARSLAKTLKIPVEVLAAVDPISVTASINARPAGFLNSYIENCVRQSGRYLDRIAHTFPSLAITCSAEKGRPEEIIIWRAARDPETLIIMATHGRSGLDRWLMGSVAEKVLRATANPLLVVRAVEDGKTTGEVGWKSVIVPLDGSELAELVLPSVITLAREMKLEVMLARAYEIPATAYYGSEDYLPNYEAIKEQIREEAHDYLVNKTEDLKKAGVASVSWVLLDGPGADELIKLGRSTPDNLIAMSIHGRSGVKRWVLGSVTEKIVCHSGDPVLVMPAKFLNRGHERVRVSEAHEEFNLGFRCTLD
jgi:nucleotide-binding universal stress UspA family protein